MKKEPLTPIKELSECHNHMSIQNIENIKTHNRLIPLILPMFVLSQWVPQLTPICKTEEGLTTHKKGRSIVLYILYKYFFNKDKQTHS